MEKGKGKVTVDVMDTKGLSMCVNSLQKYLDMGIKAGLYSLSDAENIILSLSSLNKSVSVLDNYQNLVKSRVKQEQVNTVSE